MAVKFYAPERERYVNHRSKRMKPFDYVQIAFRLRSNYVRDRSNLRKFYVKLAQMFSPKLVLSASVAWSREFEHAWKGRWVETRLMRFMFLSMACILRNTRAETIAPGYVKNRSRT